MSVYDEANRRIAEEGPDVAASFLSHTICEFPPDAWRGPFDRYRQMVSPTTEASDSYHFWCFATVYGATLGRRVGIYHARTLYPNMYAVLVGPTGWGRKDTAEHRALAIWTELHADDLKAEQPKYEYIPGVGSAEGLIDALGGEGKTVLVRESEFLGLLRKARQDSVSNLIPQLTALYDCPELHTLRTRSRPVTCKNLFLSILSGTTHKWLKDAISERDILGGFANRFIFVPNIPKPPLPHPPAIDKGSHDALLDELNNIRRWAEAHGGCLEVSREAVDIFATWYEGFYAWAQGDGLLPALAVRFQDYIWKLALLFAVADRSAVIGVEHVSPAISVMEWQKEANRILFADFSRSGKEQEETALQLLQQQPGHIMKKRDMYRVLHLTANKLDRLMESLVRVGMVQETAIGRNGTSSMAYQLVTL
ncbi:MAG: DUF3987 domain-containing protein [Chloroflexi bacterium]|nr:DUF3987 domain-containing protein [Chloroflexota bacterium]